MLEIFLLIYLSKKLGKVAQDKGHKPGMYKFLTFLLWFIFEFSGFVIGFIVLGEDNIFGAFVFGLVGAGFGYLIVHYWVNNLPDIKPQGDPERYE